MSDEKMTLRSAFWIPAVAAAVTPSPSPEGCHPFANGINCNFDRQEAQMIWTLGQLNYVFMAIAICVLALAIYSLVTGKSPIPVRISRLLPRTPASVGDQRWLSAGAVVVTVSVLVNLASLPLTYPGGFGHPAGPLAESPLTVITSATMLIGLLVGMTFAARVRYLDRKKGTVSSALDQLRGRPPLSIDGLHYWDGQRWVSTLSPDGRYRWNGAAWMPANDARR